MKKLYTFLAGAVLCLSSAKVMAQSYSMPDTVRDTTYNYAEAHGPVNNLTTSPITMQWRVVAHNLPADWMVQSVTGIGICDNLNCYDFSALWPSGTLKTTNTYAPGIAGDIKLTANLTNVTTLGCYYVKIKVNQQGGAATDTSSTTFIVCRTTAPSNVAVTTVHAIDEISLYPNPASNEINVVYDEGADIRNIAVYNLIGKVTNVYKVSGHSANLNIENLPSGIYFVRLMNGQGQTVVTRKFTKQ